jgi:predicted O-methyltransferase YrrM
VNELDISGRPETLPAILKHSAEIGFTMASEERTGSLLRALAASKPGGRFLEIGTGTGVGTAWLLAGMDSCATLQTVDPDAAVVNIARRHLGHDSRVQFRVADGGTFLTESRPRQFDLVYADAWPGKFTHLDEALATVAVGGIYIVDDLLPQPNWPEGHAAKVSDLLTRLDRHSERDFVATRMSWSSGLMLLVRRS